MLIALFPYIIVGLGCIFLASVCVMCFFLFRLDSHFFPSRGRCRLCKKRIYVWQRAEHRIGYLQIIRPRSQDELIEERCFVHTACKGDVSSQIHFIERRTPVSRSN